MGEYSLLKLQVDDATLTAYAPFSGAGDDSDDESVGAVEVAVDSGDGDSDDADGEGSDRSLLPLVAGLVFLVVVAVAVKRFRGDDNL